jgi:hypothetical protein
LTAAGYNLEHHSERFFAIAEHSTSEVAISKKIEPHGVVNE